MAQEILPLLEVLREVPGPRTLRGRRYSLVSILALVCVATRCGYKSYGAMAQWVEDYGPHWLERLGFTRGKAPSVGTLVGTLHSVLTRLNVQELDVFGDNGRTASCMRPGNTQNRSHSVKAYNSKSCPSKACKTKACKTLNFSMAHG